RRLLNGIEGLKSGILLTRPVRSAIEAHVVRRAGRKAIRERIDAPHGAAVDVVDIADPRRSYRCNCWQDFPPRTVEPHPRQGRYPDTCKSPVRNLFRPLRNWESLR